MARYKGDQGSILDRLLNKIIIDEVTDCWNFTGGKNNIGYGMIRDNKRMRTAHRVSYEEHKGPIPHGLCVMHSCDNTLCCNPNHLSLGTHKQNSDDMISKGRAKPFGSYLGSGDGMRGKKMPRTLCTHCQKLVPNNGYVRFHGEKCKSKQIE